MKQIVIENPVINSAYEGPKRHFKFDDEGITDEIVEARRTSSYFIPIPKPKKKKGHIEPELFETGWTQDRIEENKFINDVRAKVSVWRQAGYPASSVTRTTKLLLDHWTLTAAKAALGNQRR